eukprot:Gb_14744 [translate_table: standard]
MHKLLTSFHTALCPFASHKVCYLEQSHSESKLFEPRMQCCHRLEPLLKPLGFLQEWYAAKQISQSPLTHKPPPFRHF